MTVKYIKLLSTIVLCAMAFTSCTQNEITQNNIPEDASEVKPLAIGTAVPDVELSDPYGNTENLAALSTQSTVFVFYRGGWCPFCSAELAELAEIEEKLYERGIRIVGISADKPEYLRETLEGIETDFKLLSDSKMEAAKAFGIAFKVDKETVQNLKENGMDIEERSGREHHMLPVPSVFLVNALGIIEFQYVNPDYKQRIDKDVLLAAVDAMLEK